MSQKNLDHLPAFSLAATLLTLFIGLGYSVTINPCNRYLQKLLERMANARTHW